MDRKLYRDSYFTSLVLNPLRFTDGGPIFSEKPPSEEFMSAMTFHGPDFVVCEFCGRTHVSAEYDEEEAGKGVPEDAIYHESISAGYLDNKHYVVDCPCNAGTVYEKLFWQHLPLVAKYSQLTAKEQLHAAEQKLALAKSIVIP